MFAVMETYVILKLTDREVFKNSSAQFHFYFKSAGEMESKHRENVIICVWQAINCIVVLF